MPLTKHTFKMRILSAVFLLLLFCFSCGNSSQEAASESEETNTSTEKVVIYTHRHYDTDKEIFADFTKATGIEVEVVKASADELIQRMESEGDQSPADILVSVDAGRLVRAKDKGLLQSVDSEFLNTTVPARLRDANNQWFSLTKRARVIVYDKEKVDPADLSTYADLASPNWKGKVLIRSSGNIYNQSLMASVIANEGEEAARTWAKAVTENFARTPKGNDRDQVKGILAGEGQIAVVNTYYLGKLLNSADSTEVAAGENVSIFFPNQETTGAHINVSGAGVAKYAPNRENAVKLLEYLLSKEVQEKFAKANYEYPVNPNAESSDLLKSWGDFKEDELPLSKLGELNKNAVVVFDEVGWP